MDDVSLGRIRQKKKGRSKIQRPKKGLKTKKKLQKTKKKSSVKDKKNIVSGIK